MMIALLITIAASGGDYASCLTAVDHRAFVRSQMLECAIADMDRADRVLNVTYRRTIARLDPHSQEALRRKERNWIAYRRAHCLASGRDPIPSPEINRMRCLTRETIMRTATLRAMR